MWSRRQKRWKRYTRWFQQPDNRRSREPSNMLAAAQIRGAQEAARDLGAHALILEASNERGVEHAFAT